MTQNANPQKPGDVRPDNDDRDEAQPATPRVKPALSGAAKQDIPGATGGQGAAGAGGPKGFGTGD